MDVSVCYQKIGSFLREIESGISNTSITNSDVFTKALASLCETLQIVRIEYEVFVPKNSISKKDTTHSAVLYQSNLPYDDEHLKICHFNNITFQTNISTKLYWRTDLTLTEDDKLIYKTMDILFYIMFSRQNFSDIIKHTMHYDLFTDLPFLEYTARKFQTEVFQKGQAKNYVTIFCNLQNMKYYNRTLGDITGDTIIKQYAKIAQSFLEPDEYIARPGGDNIVFIIKAQRLEQAIAFLDDIPIEVNNKGVQMTLHLSTWRGISLDKEGTKPFDRRMFESSFAVQLGKNKFHSKVVYYTDEIEKSEAWAKLVTGTFSICLNQKEYVPFFQPKVHISSGKLIGMEALVRWKKDGVIIPPGRFVPILEANDLIAQLDLYMLERTCESIQKWRNMGLSVPIISSNLSRTNLYDPEIVDKIKSILKKYDVPVELIEIEITETTTFEEFTRLTEFTQKMFENGIKISIDDFGTGYSSLSLLKSIHADVLKIDKTFVDDCMKSQKAFILIRNIITLANELGIDVISEGVETQEQADFLVNTGCNNAQGYLYSAPISFEAMTDIIKRGVFERKEVEQIEELA
ncbi:MAG: EAL domain-containing protein [Treponema sp.]|nr:EAL domain-containing protein [Treponema sp.]